MRLRFTSRDGSDRISERRADPHRLVSLNRRWYLVAFDLDRDDWRTYRVDRITDLVDTGHRAPHRDAPDPAALVAEGVAVHASAVRVRLRLPVPAGEASRHIAPNVGVVEPAGSGACTVTIGGDADWIARYLAGLPVAFEIIEGSEVAVELGRLAEDLLSRVR